MPATKGLIYQGDIEDALKRIPDESIDCVITSPPYWGLRDYGTGTWVGGDPACTHQQGRVGAARTDGVVDERSKRNRDGAAALTRRECACGATLEDRQLGREPSPSAYVKKMVEVFRVIRQKLKPTGIAFVNLGDTYAADAGGGGDPRSITLKGGRRNLEATRMARPTSRIPDGLKAKDMIGVPWRVAFALQDDGWYLRMDVVWMKPSVMPESVSDRPTKSHEYVFILSKSEQYYWDTAEAKEPARSIWTVKGCFDRDPESKTTRIKGLDKGRMKLRRRKKFEPTETQDRSDRNIRSVWAIPSEASDLPHYAMFPRELVRRCLLPGCPEGGVVLDPFGGMATVGLVADQLSRNWVCVDLSPSYVQDARKRILRENPFRAGDIPIVKTMDPPQEVEAQFWLHTKGLTADAGWRGLQGIAAVPGV